MPTTTSTTKNPSSLLRNHSDNDNNIHNYPTIIRTYDNENDHNNNMNNNEMQHLLFSNVIVSIYNTTDNNNDNPNYNNNETKQQQQYINYIKNMMMRCYNNIYKWMYPIDTPIELQTLYLMNIGIPLSYFIIGITDGMIRPLLNVYPIDLNANEAQQIILSGISTLPAAFKILYGFVSDTFPITIHHKSYRRKPYMFIGWFICIISMSFLYHEYDLHVMISHTNSNNKNHHVIDTNTTTSNHYHHRHTIQDVDNKRMEDNERDLIVLQQPNVMIIGILCFIYGFGMWFADVMCDSIVAQKVNRNETDNKRGTFQSTCYTIRFFGLMLSSPISTYLYSKYNGPIMIVFILMIAPFFLLPFLFILYEDTTIPIPSMSKQLNEIWKTICSRSVWQPIGFLYLFNILQIKNAAWKQFLISCYHFTSSQLNSLLVVSYILLYLGSMTFKYCLLHTNWRTIYQFAILINAIFSLGQLLLITGNIPFGMNPFWFALGDDSVSEFVNGIQFLPCTILMVSLCPVGSEGASYAMFTTVWNSAMLSTPSLSTLLLQFFDVTKDTLENGNMNGMIQLTIITTMIQTIPIFFLFLLPSGRDELLQLSNVNSNCHNSKYCYSPIGGSIFLFILFGSMTYTATITIINITKPGW